MFYLFDLDLDMVKIYQRTKNEVPSYSGSKVIAWTDRPEWKYYLSDGNNRTGNCDLFKDVWSTP